MDITQVTQMISNVGFPIAMCLIVFYYMTKHDEQHKEETDNLRATLEDNTKVLSELCTLIKILTNGKER